MESFRKLGLSDWLIKVLKEMGFEKPREIQEKSIPLALVGRDIIGGSATGSGKTLAFGASILEHIKIGEGVKALILVPTRELAEQVAGSLREFSKYKRLSIVAIYGGVGINPQIRELEEADIVVGTPGRIIDHLERRTLNLSKVKTLVLDEADRMLDMGFIDDVMKIINLCPKERQTMLFSATISQDIQNIVNKNMKKPEYISLEAYIEPSKLKQSYYDCPQDLKFSLLLHLLKHEHSGLIMVFCNTQRNTDFVASTLRKFKIDAVAIHGGLTQSKRTRIMEHFHSGKVAILVCTDVAARGLDIENVSHVYNYDIPSGSKEYIHRIGRTARAGKSGLAVSIVTQRDYDNFRNVLRDEELKIEQIELPPMERVFVKFGHDDRRSSFRDRGENRFRGNRRSFGERRENRFGDRKREFSNKRRGFERHGEFRKRDNFKGDFRGSSGDRKFGGERRTFGNRSRFGDREKRGFGNRERSFGNRSRFGDRRSFGNRGRIFRRY